MMIHAIWLFCVTKVTHVNTCKINLSLNYLLLSGFLFQYSWCGLLTVILPNFLYYFLLLTIASTLTSGFWCHVHSYFYMSLSTFRILWINHIISRSSMLVPMFFDVLLCFILAFKSAVWTWMEFYCVLGFKSMTFSSMETNENSFAPLKLYSFICIFCLH